MDPSKPFFLNLRHSATYCSDNSASQLSTTRTLSQESLASDAFGESKQVVVASRRQQLQDQQSLPIAPLNIKHDLFAQGLWICRQPIGASLPTVQTALAMATGKLHVVKSYQLVSDDLPLWAHSGFFQVQQGVWAKDVWREISIQRATGLPCPIVAVLCPSPDRVLVVQEKLFDGDMHQCSCAIRMLAVDGAKRSRFHSADWIDSKAHLLLGAKDVMQSWLLSMGYKIALQLSHFHAMGYMHQDIKPQNIFVSFADKPSQPIGVVLGDMGTAEHLEASSQEQIAGGTPAFKAPESFFDVKRMDGFLRLQSSDIWSFGVTILTMATGKPLIECEEHNTFVSPWDGFLQWRCDVLCRITSQMSVAAALLATPSVFSTQLLTMAHDAADLLHYVLANVLHPDWQQRDTAEQLKHWFAVRQRGGQWEQQCAEFLRTNVTAIGPLQQQGKTLRAAWARSLKHVSLGDLGRKESMSPAG